ncbi:MAG: hypothetical protein NTZ44_01905 [Candidatus Nomurabacteria bacterium]|nr:hypothetical protein [Candidatus Nomurabacteria bacterium]
MKTQMTISSQYRERKSRDLDIVPKLVIANHFLKNISGLSVSDRITVEYLKEGQIIITKLT